MKNKDLEAIDKDSWEWDLGIKENKPFSGIKIADIRYIHGSDSPSGGSPDLERVFEGAPELFFHYNEENESGCYLHKKGASCKIIGTYPTTRDRVIVSGEEASVDYCLSDIRLGIQGNIKNTLDTWKSNSERWEKVCEESKK